jgi:hypothetical protein
MFSYGSEYRLRGVKLGRREAFDCVTLMLSNGVVCDDPIYSTSLLVLAAIDVPARMLEFGTEVKFLKFVTTWSGFIHD